jgi:aminoglycoside adenylyltransferase-like protein
VGATVYPEINSVLHELLSGARTLLGVASSGCILTVRSPSAILTPVRVMSTSWWSPTVNFRLRRSWPSGRCMSASRPGPRSGPRSWRVHTSHSVLFVTTGNPALIPYIDRGSTLGMVHQESGYWVIHRHMLREHGVVLVGPPPLTLIDPVHPAELCEAVRGILREWWMPMLSNGPLLQNGFYRCYAVLTMSRMLYTVRYGTIVSKPVAARWAQEALDARWTPLIREALAWSREVAPDLDETRAYIQYTCDDFKLTEKADAGEAGG